MVSLAKALLLLLLPLEQAPRLQLELLLTQAILLLLVLVLLTGLLGLDRITSRMDCILCKRHILDGSRKETCLHIVVSSHHNMIYIHLDCSDCSSSQV